MVRIKIGEIIFEIELFDLVKQSVKDVLTTQGLDIVLRESKLAQIQGNDGNSI